MATGRPRRPSLGTAPLLPGIVLVIIIFWALAAVLMLTGTLINAREIEDTVVVINGEVQPIDKDLDNVKLAGETVKISDRIDRAAKPLSGQLTQVNSAAKDIDTSAKSILVTAGTINRTVKTINGTARSINGTVTAINGSAKAINGSVTAINGNVISINGTVNSIGGKVASINTKVNSIGTKANSINSRVRSIRSGVGPVNAKSGTSINASVGSILRTVRPLSTTVDSIDRGRKGGGPDIFGVNNINRRAQTGIDAVGLVKADFDGILTNVGFGIGPNGPDHGNGIHSHANSIDCAPLLNAGSTLFTGPLAPLFAAPTIGPILQAVLGPGLGPVLGGIIGPVLATLPGTVRTQSCDT